MLDKILVVIFTYNEEDKISLVLRKVCERFKNVLVVDNNSTDKTIEIVKKFSVYYVKHKYNLGKSNSMKTGLNFAELNHFKYVAFMDGDGQHKAFDLENICQKIYKDNGQLVIGYRKNLNNLNFKKKIGTIVLSKFFYLLYKKKIFDIQSGLRAFNIFEKKNIYWESTGMRHYFADAEITCNAVKNGCKIEQVPIETLSSEKYKGMNILQGLYLMLMIFIWRFF